MDACVDLTLAPPPAVDLAALQSRGGGGGFNLTAILELIDGGAGPSEVVESLWGLALGFVGGKFFPSMFLGGCVGCAIFIWWNDEGVNVVQLS